MSTKSKTRKTITSPNGGVLSLVYDIWISGTKLSLERKQCINSIEIKETVEGSDTATIVISDPNFMFIEDNIFLDDNTITIKAGWSNSNYRIEFKGYISTIDIDFASTGIPKLTITCMDNTHKMNRKKKSKTFKNTTSASVVKSIVQSYGFKCVIESSYNFTKQETITQSNQTDIDFIQSLARDEVHPFTARLVGNTFYYVKMGHYTTPRMELAYIDYPHEVISFSPKINKESKQVEIKSSSISTGSKKVSNTKGTQANSDGNKHKSGSSSNNTGSTKVHKYNYTSRTWS